MKIDKSGVIEQIDEIIKYNESQMNAAINRKEEIIKMSDKEFMRLVGVKDVNVLESEK